VVAVGITVGIGIIELTGAATQNFASVAGTATTGLHAGIQHRTPSLRIWRSRISRNIWLCLQRRKPLIYSVLQFPLFAPLFWRYTNFAYRMLTALTERLPERQRGPHAMAQGRISKRSVDALVCPPGKDREFLWDDAIAGFGVGAFPSGKKVYVAQSGRAVGRGALLLASTAA
jgi:hypothetical protein